ncbi:predicted protein [Phaeodactylum tricornutum CCAP 1055/1]|uniref:Uncharacterized protein n=1 Tax=Phaeodactylum tricornutum (strain CCAP 1055/1) TaxID=556484 RepID=B7G0S6_PHATC|nr:predicted protein [Phaeodactylum tricornutum CCAP 1055/1]EEC47941.1 predicted protein [Phaeodactylum tricornutum CCAP 1055/1]|eukprot:XP_002180533.1 predicted protein [Phaeodactylum tricornutum CCAP 1055/1]
MTSTKQISSRCPRFTTNTPPNQDERAVDLGHATNEESLSQQRATLSKPAIRKAESPEAFPNNFPPMEPSHCAKLYVPSKEFDSSILTHFSDVSVHGRSINVVPEDFPSLSRVKSPDSNIEFVNNGRPTSLSTKAQSKEMQSRTDSTIRSSSNKNISLKLAPEKRYALQEAGRSLDAFGDRSRDNSGTSSATFIRTNRRIARNESNISPPHRSLDGGEFEIEVYHRPAMKRLEEHNEDVANFQRCSDRIVQDSHSQTNAMKLLIPACPKTWQSASSPSDRLLRHDDAASLGGHDCFAVLGQGREIMDRALELSLNDSVGLSGHTEDDPSQFNEGEPMDRLSEIDQDKRRFGLNRDRSQQDASSRTSHTAGTMASRSHVSVHQMDADSDTEDQDDLSPRSGRVSRGRWLPQHTRWEERKDEEPETSDHIPQIATRDIDWRPRSIDSPSFISSSYHSRAKGSSNGKCPLEQTHAQRTNNHSRNTNSSRTDGRPSRYIEFQKEIGWSSHSRSSSRHSKKDDAPRKPRHATSRSPTKDIEWAPRNVDIPPSESRSSRRTRCFSPIDRREINWLPKGISLVTPISDREKKLRMSCGGDFSPIKPARHWQQITKEQATLESSN